ncbi:hypothetical protein [Desulfogranum mediterraneum]|uniref:hypothetical protein n=1 Tax=Desulfogranum mediterraneum TaxID=160661 RepID=UPI0003FC1B59|nr:hypothetical protein [Desulfogranum mediterraneum]
MNIVQIDHWRDYQRDGQQFLALARRAYDQGKEAFSLDTLYNLTCMGIEKLIMAFLMQRADLADNHTMGDLLLAVESHLGVQEEFAQQMSYLDGFQEICDLESYTTRIPGDVDMVRILAIGREIEQGLLPHLAAE